ncbi:MAG: hypothetical protein R3178_03155, partial [Rhodothermales bacterium]|nr:hypothetical protein [Rhodothermales bacterium]
MSHLSTEAAGRVDRLIGQIEHMQSGGSASYSPGIFPSRRTHPYFRYSVDDETIFFTVAILYTLKELTPYLSAAARDHVAAMTSRSGQQVPRFRNR